VLQHNTDLDTFYVMQRARERSLVTLVAAIHDLRSVGVPLAWRSMAHGQKMPPGKYATRKFCDFLKRFITANCRHVNLKRNNPSRILRPLNYSSGESFSLHRVKIRGKSSGGVSEEFGGVRKSSVSEDFERQLLKNTFFQRHHSFRRV